MIPFLDLNLIHKEIENELKEAVLRVINSQNFIGGAEVEDFEKEYANYCGVNYCVGVGNGYDALHLSLCALGVVPGDEVIVPSNTYIATWLAVSNCGAKPVPVEPDPVTYNIDSNKIESALTSKTKAIIPVHLYGLPSDLDNINRIAKRYGLFVLEDAAQAHGSSYKGKKIGGHSDIVAWSFYPSKNLGAMGDAGAITTNNREISDKIRLLRNYGSNKRYINEIQGFNSRLDPIQASILRVKLKYLDKWNSRRRQIASYYSSLLADTAIITPYNPIWANSAWHIYAIRYSKRDYLMRRLYEEGIETLIHYPIPPYKQKAYLNYSSIDNYPISSEISQQLISIPVWPMLTDAKVYQIAETINNIIN